VKICAVLGSSFSLIEAKVCDTNSSIQGFSSLQIGMVSTTVFSILCTLFFPDFSASFFIAGRTGRISLIIRKPMCITSVYVVLKEQKQEYFSWRWVWLRAVRQKFDSK
jgi:hypothetical protein